VAPFSASDLAAILPMPLAVPVIKQILSFMNSLIEH